MRVGQHHHVMNGGGWIGREPGECSRRDCRGNVGLLVCCWAGADAVIFLEQGLLLGDDSAGGHDELGRVAWDKSDSRCELGIGNPHGSVDRMSRLLYGLQC